MRHRCPYGWTPCPNYLQELIFTDINQMIANELKLRKEQVDNAVALMDDDKTIPFIARYRKEVTGSLDDTVLRALADRLTYLRNLQKRKEEITHSITEQGKMTEDIAAAIEKALLEAKEQGIHGKETTPFLLARIKDITGGDSLASNIQLVLNNARLAAATARCLAISEPYTLPPSCKR